MPWFMIDPRAISHPTSGSLDNATFALWIKCGAWMATYPQELDMVPIQVARSFGNKRQAGRLVECGLWVEADGGYYMRRTMNLGGSGLMDDFWAVGRTENRAHIPPRVRTLVYRRDGHRCVECGSSDDLTLDHIHPWSKGGSDLTENLRTLCRSCNSKKGARV